MINENRKVFIIVLNWNRVDLTLECLASLKGIKKNNFEISIIVVDQNSSETSYLKIKKSYPLVQIIKTSSNIGWTGGNNLAIQNVLKKKAAGVVLVNNDAIVDKKCIFYLLTCLFSKKTIGIVGPKIYIQNSNPPRIANAGNFMKHRRYFGTPLGFGEVDKRQYDYVDKTDYIAGTVMAIKTEVFKKIGLFDDRFFSYYEDNDFCLQARDKGFTCHLVPKATAYHRGAATAKLDSPLHTYYNTRNHLLFIEKHAPSHIKLREYLRIPKTIYEYASCKNKITRKYGLLGIRDYFFRRFGKREYW